MTSEPLDDTFELSQELVQEQFDWLLGFISRLGIKLNDRSEGVRLFRTAADKAGYKSLLAAIDKQAKAAYANKNETFLYSQCFMNYNAIELLNFINFFLLLAGHINENEEKLTQFIQSAKKQKRDEIFSCLGELNLIFTHSPSRKGKANDTLWELLSASLLSFGSIRHDPRSGISEKDLDLLLEHNGKTFAIECKRCYGSDSYRQLAKNIKGAVKKSEGVEFDHGIAMIDLTPKINLNELRSMLRQKNSGEAARYLRECVDDFKRKQGTNLAKSIGEKFTQFNYVIFYILAIVPYYGNEYSINQFVVDLSTFNRLKAYDITTQSSEHLDPDMIDILNNLSDNLHRSFNRSRIGE